MPTDAPSQTVTAVATDVAEMLLKLAQHQGGKAANDKAFQRLLNYSSIDQTEQDRCFNELVVTAIGYAYYRLDGDVQPRELWEFTEMIRQAFPEAYRSQLSAMDLASQFVDQWLQLLDLRLKEYGTDLEEMGPQLRLDMANDDNDTSSAEVKQLTTRLSLLSTAALQHLRRGNRDEKDPLRKYLRSWLLGFEQVLSPLMQKMAAIAKHEYEPEV